MGGKLKILARISYGLLVFVILTATMLSLISLLESKESSPNVTWYNNLFIVLVFPDAFLLIKDIWTSSILSRRQYRKWPELKYMLLGIFMSLLNGPLVTYLVLKIFPVLPQYILPALLYWVSIITACGPFKKTLPFGYRKHWPYSNYDHSSTVLGILQFVLMLTSTILFAHLDMLQWKQSILLFFVTCFVSIVKYKPLQKMTFGINLPSQQNSNFVYRVLRLSGTTLSLIWIYSEENGLKMDAGSTNFWSEFYNIFSKTLHSETIIIFVGAVLLQFQYYIPKGHRGLSIISIVSTFVSSIAAITIQISFNVHDIHPFHERLLRDNIPLSASHIILYTLLSILHFLCFFNFLNKSLTVGSYTENYENTRLVYYDNIFLHQNFLLNLFPLETEFVSESTHLKQTRIFICTTMYQESAYEMNRLLTSLNRLSKSRAIRKRKIYLESHIFLDNGANGREIKEFGIQLLSLIEDVFSMEEQYGMMIHTPYGINLSWNIPGKMPLFVHLKDNTLVKSKKRWSQVMYMKYIITYRAPFLKHKEDMFDSLFSSENISTESLGVELTVEEESNSQFLTIPRVMFDSSSKESSFSDLTTITDIEAVENNDPNNETETNFDTRVALKIPKLKLGYNHMITNNGGDCNTSETKIDVDKKEENNDRFRSNSLFPKENIGEDRLSFNEIEFEYHQRRSENENKMSNDDIYTIFNEEKGHIPTDDFILATDADMSFNDDSVLNLIETFELEQDVGGVCGRTFPIGLHRHPIVWLQMFDYAKDFWMIKSAQNIIGSVMCCPGCFSLFRFQAIQDVIDIFSEPTTSMEDVFTKDNGEDRWMCTLMMRKGWKLRYSYHGNNTTFCPEETEEFMKQRRRWLLSDFANALVVTRNLFNLMRTNTSFTLLYAVYILQLFLVMVLYPGSTIMMLSLGFELVSSVPLLLNAGFLSALAIVYCFIQIYLRDSKWKVIISKLLIILLGCFTVYVFVATSVIVTKDIQQDFYDGEIRHIENLVLIGVVVTYLYAAFLHPLELSILMTGLVYLFYLPFLNIILPLYAVCNIIDQSWGTRDNQKASLPKLLRLPKFKKRRKKKSFKSRSSSYESLSSSALYLEDISQDEVSFWRGLVARYVGKDVNSGISDEERTNGLRQLRNKSITAFLILNFIWISVLCGFYAFLTKFFTDKLVYGIVVVCLLGLSPLIQLIGMTVYRVDDLLRRMISKLA